MMPINEDTVEELVEMLSSKRASSNADAWRVGACLKGLGIDGETALALFHDFCRKGARYDRGRVDFLWGRINPTGAIKAGSLFYWAKLDSPVAFEAFRAEQTREMQARARELQAQRPSTGISLPRGQRRAAHSSLTMTKSSLPEPCARCLFREEGVAGGRFTVRECV